MISKMNDSQKIIVMTGGTSGLGALAARIISEAPDTQIILGARSTNASSKFETPPLDLARLESVRAFAKFVSDTLGEKQISGLVLNAGTQFKNLDHRTEDGFETTFGVNHLAHYLLLQLLLPKLALGATVLITTSDTHAMVKQLNPDLLAHPQSNGHSTGFLDGFRAYAASKLCNLLTATALAATKFAKEHGLTIIAYNPGYTPGTRLDRDWPFWIQIVPGFAKLISPIVKLNTVELAGESLAELSLGHVTPPSGHVYASLVKRRLTWPDPSELARQDKAMKTLWQESARMLRLSNVEPLP